MTTINELSAVSTLSGGDLVPVFSTSNGDARKASMTVIAAYVAQNLGAASGTSITLDSYARIKGVTVANLPSAVTAGLGARATVTDSNATLAAGHGNTVVGGSSNIVPVYSDGSAWRIG